MTELNSNDNIPEKMQLVAPGYSDWGQIITGRGAFVTYPLDKTTLGTDAVPITQLIHMKY